VLPDVYITVERPVLSTLILDSHGPQRAILRL
jgi:hypothetical protein